MMATHNRAGEITYKQIGPLTFEITLITFTDPTTWSRALSGRRAEGE
jgi:hypothetical protein